MGAPAKEVQQQSGSAAATSVRPTKLFIGGITRNTTTKQLRDHFERFGRVLDCVAMRMPDGRPRGFGYVTLDSPKAAENCLAMPQVIDGRIVDLKRAVPEADMDSTVTTRLHTPGNSNIVPHGGSQGLFPAHGFEQPIGGMHGSWPNVLATDPMSTDYGLNHLMGGAGIHGGCPTLGPQLLQTPALWPPTPLSFGPPDCVELLSTGRTMFYPPEDDQQWKGLETKVVSDLKADAAEFVPQATQEKPPENKSNQPKKRTALGEITNTIGSAETSVFSTSPKKVVLKGGAGVADDGLSGNEFYPKRVTGLNIHADELPLQIDTDNIFQDPSATTSPTLGSAPSPELETASQSSEDDSLVSSKADEVLPSVGSADHANGTCKRCNFFAKGRCQNGQDCSFCHFPHEKKKPSRQEKRERKAEWLAKNAALQAQCTPTGCDISAQPTIGSTMIHGLSTVPIVDHSSVISACSPASPFVAPPPGLSFGEMPWQPEVEASPVAAAMPLLATIPLPPVVSSAPPAAASHMLAAQGVLMSTSSQIDENLERVACKADAPDPATRYTREQLLRLRAIVPGHAVKGSLHAREVASLK